MDALRNRRADRKFERQENDLSGPSASNTQKHEGTRKIPHKAVGVFCGPAVQL